jgi:hypothetical protein
MALGPAGLNLLSPPVLSYLDPVVSVALVVLGLSAGLELHLRRGEAILLGAASVEAGLTLLLVTGGIVLVHSRVPLSNAPWLFALMFGISAAVSSTPATEPSDPESAFSMRVGDLDDVLPIVLGAVALASIQDTDLGRAVWTAGQGGLVALVMAVAGWLLVVYTPAESEQHVFVVGTLLLLGGAAAYLSASALFAGLVAGACWSFAGGAARGSLDRALSYLQHPLIILLLLVAGARLQVATWTLGLVVVYVLCRAVGKWVGGRVASWLVPREYPLDLGRQLISPGVMAIAFALNVSQAGFQSEAADMLLAVAVLGSLGSEALSLVAYPHRRST